MSGKFEKRTIRDVMKEINLRYFLPDIQREFVWLSNEKEQKIERLFDSILRGYPINSFLFWKIPKKRIVTGYETNEEDLKDKLNFQLYKFIENYDYKKPHNQKKEISQIENDELYVVLDGQQRLTSLYIGLKGTRKLKKKYSKAESDKSETKALYLNLRHHPDPKEPDDMYEFTFITPERAKTDNLNESKKYNWFKVGDILEKDPYDLKENLPKEEGRIIDELYKSFCIKELIAYFEEDDDDLVKVLNIFIRINNGGTQLSYSDLLMSILTSAFETDIRERLNDEIDDVCEKGFACFGRDQMLKTALFLVGANHKFTLQNFNKANIDRIEENLDKIFQSVNKAINILKEMGYENNLSSGYIVTVIAFWIYSKNLFNSNIKGDEWNAMLEFVRLSQLLSYFSTALDSKLNDVKDSFKDVNSFREFITNMSKLEAGKALKVTQNDIDNFLQYKYGKHHVLSLLQILYPGLRYDGTKSFHIDHIYPRAKFKKYNDLADKKDYIWNLQLLEGSLNKSKNDEDPDKWIEKEFSNPLDKENYYKENYIESDFVLSWDNFEEFEEMRREKLKAKLEQLLLNEK